MRHLGLAILFTFLLDGTSQAEDCAKIDPRSSIECILVAYDTNEQSDLKSVVVIRNGDWLAERYFGDADENTLIDIRSAGKSVTSLLMGIALDQGLIESINDPVARYWPEAEDSAVGPVRLAEVLTMRTGLDADADDPASPGYEDFMDASDNPIAWALTITSSTPPGTIYRYNSLAAYVAGVVVGRAADKGMEEFARENLFTPLGITNYDWQEDRSGITKGQGNLFLTATGFARIGAMVLNGGKHEGRQVVSEHWIHESLTPRVNISTSTSNADHYGYYWYQRALDVNGRDVKFWFASGNGGNKIYIVPAFDMVITVMSTAYGQGRGHRRSEAILKAVLALQQHPPFPRFRRGGRLANTRLPDLFQIAFREPEPFSQRQQ